MQFVSTVFLRTIKNITYIWGIIKIPEPGLYKLDSSRFFYLDSQWREDRGESSGPKYWSKLCKSRSFTHWKFGSLSHYWKYNLHLLLHSTVLLHPTFFLSLSWQTNLTHKCTICFYALGPKDCWHSGTTTLIIFSVVIHQLWHLPVNGITHVIYQATISA